MATIVELFIGGFLGVVFLLALLAGVIAGVAATGYAGWLLVRVFQLAAARVRP